jgi:hypothetical protein
MLAIDERPFNDKASEAVPNEYDGAFWTSLEKVSVRDDKVIG